MFDFETTVAEIEWKVRKLMEENERLRTEVERSAEQCQQLQEQVNSQNITINNLKEQNNRQTQRRRRFGGNTQRTQKEISKHASFCRYRMIIMNKHAGGN